MKYLKPLIDKDSYHKELQQDIYRELYKTIFEPIFLILQGDKELKNAKTDALLEALRKGVVFYDGKQFKGKFTAKISKLLREIGAKYSAKDKAFKLPAESISTEIKIAIAQGNAESNAKIEKVNDLLKRAEAKDIKIEIVQTFNKIIDKLNNQFHDTTKPITMRIEEIPLREDLKGKLAKEYTENLSIYIKKWQNEQILRLREVVQKNVQGGFRAESLIERIQAENQVSYNKAKFLAKQETSLLTSKYRQIRYEEVGIQYYKWSTSHDHRVRSRHKELDGKIFSFNNPPIVDIHTGRRANAGEDFNCLPEDSNINLAYGIEKCFRRWYTGELTTLITDSGKTIRATPNHQVLTIRGWQPIGLLDCTDHVIDLSDELIKSFKDNINNSETTIGELFKSLSNDFPMLTTNGIADDFHGDGTNSNINVVNTASGLCLNRKINISKRLNQLFFSLSDSLNFQICKFPKTLCIAFFSMCQSCQFSNISKLLIRRFAESNNISFATITNLDASLNQSFSNNDSFQSSPFRYGKLAFPINISFNNWLRVKIKSVFGFSSNPSIGNESSFSQYLRKIVRTKADNLSGFTKRFSAINKISRIVKVSSSHFSGHVYNLQTINNWYCYDGIIVHNCRCVAIPILDDTEIRKAKLKQGEIR